MIKSLSLQNIRRLVGKVGQCLRNLQIWPLSKLKIVKPNKTYQHRMLLSKRFISPNKWQVSKWSWTGCKVCWILTRQIQDILSKLLMHRLLNLIDYAKSLVKMEYPIKSKRATKKYQERLLRSRVQPVNKQKKLRNELWIIWLVGLYSKVAI